MQQFRVVRIQKPHLFTVLRDGDGVDIEITDTVELVFANQANCETAWRDKAISRLTAQVRALGSMIALQAEVSLEATQATQAAPTISDTDGSPPTWCDEHCGPQGSMMD
tara:strand:- start:65 stop:391 length:327 start_codon:yes stop_codon:yes gene_type:complete